MENQYRGHDLREAPAQFIKVNSSTHFTVTLSHFPLVLKWLSRGVWSGTFMPKTNTHHGLIRVSSAPNCRPSQQELQTCEIGRNHICVTASKRERWIASVRCRI